MTGYFDDAVREGRDPAREFPDDLREKILGKIALWALNGPGTLPPRQEAIDWLKRWATLAGGSKRGSVG